MKLTRVRDDSIASRILLCAYQVPNRSNGGLESATCIFESLSYDQDWTLVTTRETAFTSRWRERGATVIISSFNELGSRFVRALNYARWSARILFAACSSRADCIHANDIRAYQAASIPARLLRKPLLLTVRDTKPEGELYGAHWRRAARQCERIVALSDDMRHRLERRIGIPRERLCTINSIVDLNRFRPLDPTERTARRVQLGIAEDEFIIGSIGAISEKKNQLELIEKVMPSLLISLPKVRLHVFGDFVPETDPYAARCWGAVKRLNLEQHVLFHGHIDGVADWMPSLDCIVIASRREGMARCMIEGMACGVPVVSFELCSAQEMLGDTGAGKVVPLGDYSALATALIELGTDVKRSLRMGRCGRKTAVRLFNAERIREAYQTLYQEVIS